MLFQFQASCNWIGVINSYVLKATKTYLERLNLVWSVYLAAPHADFHAALCVLIFVAGIHFAFGCAWYDLYFVLTQLEDLLIEE